MSADVRLTLLLFALSFFIAGVPRVYTQTAAHALFIEAYGAQAMPWAYLAEALCVPLAGWAYLRAERVASLRVLLVGTLATQIVALLLFRAGIGAGVPLVAGASIVYFEIEFVLSSLLLWGLASQLMTLRQGKRLFGFVAAGEPVAIIVCGLSTPWLLRWMSTADLFLMSALGAAVGIVLVMYILRHHQPLEAVADSELPADGAPAEPDAGLGAWWRNRYVVTLVLLVAVGQMVYFLVDSAFYIEAEKRYPGQQEMASFLGLYSAVVGAASLACSVLLAPWLMRRFGVRAALLALPVLLLAGALATLAGFAFGGPAELLFLFVVGNKVIDQSLRYTVDKTTIVTLFQPLPANQRMRLQAGLESMVEPLSGGVAGLLLFALLHLAGFGAAGITGVVLALACVWVGLVAVQYRGYLGALRAALARRAFSTPRLVPDSEDERALVRQGLRSARPGEVLYCLSLMDGLALPLTPGELRSLVRHPSREVRLHLARRAEQGASKVAPELLAESLKSETDDEVRGAWLEALAAAAPDPAAALSAWVTAADDPVRLGAWVGLVRHGGVEGALVVGPALLGSLRSADASQRRFAARVLERVGSTNFYRQLLPLLSDADVGVARAALRAAGRIASRPLWPAMLQALQQPALERGAVLALAAVGDPILPALDAPAVAAMPAGLQIPTARVAVLERMASPAADARLLDLLGTPSAVLRHRALQALWRRRLRCPPAQLERVQGLLLDEVDHAGRALELWWRLRGAPFEHAAADGPPARRAEAVAQVRRVLADQVAAVEDRCFALLALLLPGLDMQQARVHHRNGSATQRAYVLELLDNGLDHAIRQRVLPLLEAPDMAHQARCVAPSGAASETGGSATEQGSEPLALATLDTIAADPHAEGLLRACAAYAVALHAPPSMMRSIDSAAPAADLPTPQGLPLHTLAWHGHPLLDAVRTWVEAGFPGMNERDDMLTIEKMLILKSVTLFAAVREHNLAHVAASARELRLAAGQALFAAGDAGDALYVVVAGRLAVSVRGQRVSEVGEREVVGEMAVLDPEPRSASVAALQDSVLLRITAADLGLLMEDDADLARGIIQILCRRLRHRDVVP